MRILGLELFCWIFWGLVKEHRLESLTSKYGIVEKSSGHECSRTVSVFSRFALGTSLSP